MARAKGRKPRLKRGSKKQPRLKRGTHIVADRYTGKATTSPPAGFKSIRGDPDVIEKVIRAVLTSAHDELPPALYDASRVRIHKYRDGTIDGELMVRIPHGVKPRDASEQVEEAFGHREVHPEIWIQTGVRYTIQEDDEIYRKFQGMNELNVFFQRSTRHNVGDVFAIQREEQMAGLDRKYGRQAEMIYVRLHWNKENARPEPERRS